MPQFDITTYSSQIFWVLVSFFSLIFLMRFMILPRIENILLKRSRAISYSISTAQELNDEAKNLALHYDSILSDARVTSEKMIKDAIEKITRERIAAEQAFHQKMSAKMALIDDQIHTMEKDVMHDVESMVAYLVNQVLDHIHPDHTLTDVDITQAVKTVMAKEKVM